MVLPVHGVLQRSTLLLPVLLLIHLHQLMLVQQPHNAYCNVTTQVTPTFDPITLCQNSTPTALPLISNNGVNGTWSPATINTAVAGSSTYTFTPTDACATTAQLTVTITTLVTPTFDPITLCQNSTPTALPLISNNGVNGTWSPATINTAVAGSSTYTFTPTDACATTAQLTVTITTLVTPIFDPITLCQNSTPTALPLISNNGVNGTWSPATINTAVAGSSTYTFTPTDGQCAVPFTMSVVVPSEILATHVIVNTTCTASIGAINITVSGGTSPYTYLWSNGATTEDVSGLAAGNYTVTVTDANGCANNMPFTVETDNSTITVTPVVTNTTCTASIGAINITVSGGTSPYTYLWSNGATTEDISGLAAGTYTVTVTDANGCTTNMQFTVETDIVNHYSNTCRYQYNLYCFYRCY